MARQLLHEVERARRFYMAEIGACEGEQFFTQFIACFGPVRRFDDGYDLLTHHLVRRADNRDVGHLGMRDE